MSLPITAEAAAGLYPSELRYEPRTISGFRPVTEPHLALHLGVLQYIVLEQNRHPSGNYCLIADWHATTNWFSRPKMRQATLNTSAALLALGVNPYRTLLFAQSHVAGLGEMAWLLSCMTPASLLLRNPAPPNPGLNKDNIGVVLYPVLMAADVLSLRGTKLVVPRDQILNSRKVRQIALAANRMLGAPVFPVPQPVVRGGGVPGTDGARMDLERGNHIPIFLDLRELRQCVQRIHTDSRGPREPDTCTVFRLYSMVASEERVREMRDRYLSGRIQAVDAKAELALALAEAYAPARERYQEWLTRPDDIRDVLRAGAQAVSSEVAATLAQVREKLGLAL